MLHRVVSEDCSLIISNGQDWCLASGYILENWNTPLNFWNGEICLNSCTDVNYISWSSSHSIIHIIITSRHCHRQRLTIYHTSPNLGWIFFCVEAYNYLELCKTQFYSLLLNNDTKRQVLRCLRLHGVRLGLRCLFRKRVSFVGRLAVISYCCVIYIIETYSSG